jgi:hypothetical protein
MVEAKNGVQDQITGAGVEKAVIDFLAELPVPWLEKIGWEPTGWELSELR